MQYEIIRNVTLITIDSISPDEDYSLHGVGYTIYQFLGGEMRELSGKSQGLTICFIPPYMIGYAWFQFSGISIYLHLYI